MSDSAVFVYSSEIEQYNFSNSHPFNQVRVTLSKDLLTSVNQLSDNSIIAPRLATDEEIALFHDVEYIQAVKDAGLGLLSEEKAANYGIGTEDTPIFPNMHEASARIVGGTLSAVDAIMSGRALHSLHLGGGLHHGFRGKASGFCVYNDIAVAIKYIQKNYNLRVLYVDTDAHHGDGVQFAFYDDPTVCTLSIHETGRYLFPGTGNVHERGYGDGYGYSFNIPLDAFTEDESFLQAYEASLQEIAAFFKPDIIITQNGADAHHLDPLTHLSCSMKIYESIPKLAHKIAHQYCGGRWIALGGGGYDIWRVVPRAWSMVWLEMNEISSIYKEPIPQEWIQAWQPKSSLSLPTSWYDPDNLVSPIPRKPEINQKNTLTVDKALQPIRNNT
ncbi:acetoin utilization protein AcuC [Bacillus suaedaesalsae]|uniref:Acetoin utilization protein AcuC n=1 Tax=Bacillus suaedaesalsae TaxID=2810349 RepID=A0ABS2DD85_9BACI|nr:acetoin utilization protein AcuC [Bacillus suaedaesalsae]MBM6616417.1 acetoin utilization protein AcuC [Bacillus suaedaesalsae]